MNPEDILIWPDGFWCYRKEADNAPKRDADFTVLPQYSPKWFRLARPQRAQPPKNDHE